MRHMVPAKHQKFLDAALNYFKADARALGVAAGGSLCAATMDEYSDLDLVVVVAPHARAEIMAERKQIAAKLGPMLTVFTAEHVGEPRMVIAIYGPPPLHVDLKFIDITELEKRVENPRVLFERDGALSAVIAATQPAPPGPINLEWLEERFWGWTHYNIEKTLRGEWLECHAGAGFVNNVVLGPMALTAAGYSGLDKQGVRRLETRAPEVAAKLRACMAAHDRASFLRVWQVQADLYTELRQKLSCRPVIVSAAEKVVREYLAAHMK
ncbi:MAG: oxalate:formate antiporter [Planctomycetes bacterium]|nr:oxalate:formate antiporter [Planctomycetota bacterium]